MRAISGGRHGDIGALRVLCGRVLRVLLLLVRVWRFVRSTIGAMSTRIGAMSTRVYLPWRVAWREAEEVV